MSTVQQARKDIRYLSSLVRGLVALDEELEKAGSIEKLIRDREEQVAAADKRLAEIQTLVEQNRVIAEKARLGAAETTAKLVADAEQAKREADDLKNQARAAVAASRAERDAVRADSARIVTDAEQVAAKIVAATQDETASHNMEHSRKLEQLTAIDVEIATHQESLERIKAEIAKLKSKFA